MWRRATQQGEDDERGRGGHREHGEAETVARHRHHRGHEQRPSDRAGLVQGLLNGERPATAQTAARRREHGGLRGTAHRLAESFRHHGEHGLPQQLGRGEQRHRDHGDRVADDRDRPRPPGPVRQRTRGQPQDQRYRFTGTGHHPDDCGTGAQRGQIRADDRPRPLVHEVAEQGDDAEPDDEPHGTQLVPSLRIAATR